MLIKINFEAVDTEEAIKSNQKSIALSNHKLSEFLQSANLSRPLELSMKNLALYSVASFAISSFIVNEESQH